MLEIIRARWGNTAHKVFFCFAITTNSECSSWAFPQRVATVCSADCAPSRLNCALSCSLAELQAARGVCSRALAAIEHI
jgi:hypothetical protein